MQVLVTGAAGFIGFHLSRKLLAAGHKVIGIDNLNRYYSVKLKEDRLALLKEEKGFSFFLMDLTDMASLKGLFADHDFTHVVNLAAQAGVRYSLENPGAYLQSNVVGFGNILECCRYGGVKHLVFASSSSVYGLSRSQPYSVHQNVDHPISFYAASKKANELMAHSYSHLYGLPATGLRFFTVYGPWGRPDMALFLFTKAILAGEPIDVFNYGKMQRDFTYIDDIVEGVVRVMGNIPKHNEAWDCSSPDPGTSSAPWRIYNIGNNRTVELKRLIEILEDVLGKKAQYTMLPMQPGDVESTWANVDDLKRDTGFSPDTSIEYGIKKFVEWYKEYFRVQ